MQYASTVSLFSALALVGGCGDWGPPQSADWLDQARVGELITSIDSPPVVTIDEVFEVRVTTDPGVDVTMDGRAGSALAFDFSRPGSYTIEIEAVGLDSRGEIVDTELVTVEVVEPVFAVDCVLDSGGPYRVRCTATSQGVPADASGYTWNFERTEVRTRGGTAPTVVLDLSDSVDHEQAESSVGVSVHEDGTSRSASTTVVLGSHVDLARQHGVLLPLVEPPVVPALACPFTVDFEIANPVGDDWVFFNRFVRRVHSCDPTEPSWANGISAVSMLGDGALSEVASFGYPTSDLGRDEHPTGPGEITLDPHEVYAGQLVVECDDIPPNACALEYDLIGTTRAGLHAQAALWVSLKDPNDAGTEVSRTTRQTLLTLIDQGLVADPMQITEEELLALEASGVTRRTALGWEMN